MTGALRLKTKFVLPPGDEDVVKKLRLEGEFTMAGTRFTEPGRAAEDQQLEPSQQGKGAEETQRVTSQFSAPSTRPRHGDDSQVTFDVRERSCA